MTHLLVTGVAGFIGSNFVYHVLGTHPEISIVGLDSLTYAGNLENLAALGKKEQERFTFVKGDIGDRPLADSLFSEHAINAVVNFAAESHVDRSIEDPQLFLRTNILGTCTLLDAARAAWQHAAPSIADLRIAGGKVSSAKREVALDFGGYLKGVALDRAAAALREAGIANALINIGGNVMALGSKHGEPWRVGIQHPRQPGALATLQLHDGEAIGTSGDYQRFFELDGKRYCHLLDPRSAAPVTHTQSLTVLIRAGEGTGMRSDAGSKPLFIGGREEWRRLARKLEVADVLRVDADGSIQVTRLFAGRLKFEAGVPSPEIIE